MNYIETITAVIRTLKTLFQDKGELRGFDDWDSLIGCVVALENISQALQSENSFEKDMEKFKQEEGEIISTEE